MSQEITGPDKINTQQRKDIVLGLRQKGWTYAEIVQEMFATHSNITPKSYSRRHAWEDVNEEIEKMRRENKESAATLVEIENLRLNNLYKEIEEVVVTFEEDDEHNTVKKINLKAVDRLLKISEKLALLNGLNKPVEHKITDWRSEIIEFLKQGRLTMEQIRLEMGEDAVKQIIEAGGGLYLLPQQRQSITVSKDVNVIDLESKAVDD
jgi:hypothetical protein